MSCLNYIFFIRHAFINSLIRESKRLHDLTRVIFCFLLFEVFSPDYKTFAQYVRIKINNKNLNFDIRDTVSQQLIYEMKIKM